MNPILRRDLEFLQFEHKGELYILVRDPLGLVPENKVLRRELFELLVHMDGSRSLRDIQYILMRAMGGTIVSIDEVRGLVQSLEQDFILDSPIYREMLSNIKRSFEENPIRPAYHSAKSYPEDPKALKSFLEDLMADAQGSSERISALVAPHIDLKVGKKVYGKTYAFLLGHGYERVMVLGVGHSMVEGIFSVCTKDFETPFGILENDREATLRLSAPGVPVMDSQFVHREEHSIEFQLLFLRYCLKGPFKIIPVLCGHVGHLLDRPVRESYLSLALPFIHRLREELERQPNTLIVAGIDLSHIGPKFGDPYPASYLEREARAHDNALLSAFSELDKEAFWKEYARVGDRYHVCGMWVMALLLELLEGLKGSITGYELWQEEATRSAVSFAGVVFSRKEGS